MSESNDRNRHMVEIGRKGGKRGGPARARKLSHRRRAEIALQGANARWNVGRNGRSKKKA